MPKEKYKGQTIGKRRAAGMKQSALSTGNSESAPMSDRRRSYGSTA
jgi:hypothetical protein